MTLLHQELTSSIINCAYKVRSALGSGLLESAYEECPVFEGWHKESNNIVLRFFLN